MRSEVALQVGVKMVVKNKHGKYLLLRRSLQKYPDVKGRWDIAGGRINAGSPLLENLQREIREETGLQVIGTPKLIAAQDILHSPERHVVRLTYVGKAEGEVILDTEENDQFHWLSWDELLTFDNVGIYLKELLDDALVAHSIKNG